MNTTTSVPTRIGSAVAFGVDETNPQGLTVLDGVLYMIGGNTDSLYTLDVTTGVATKVGDLVQFGASEAIPTAIAEHNGNLYMTGKTVTALYRSDTGFGKRWGIILPSATTIDTRRLTLTIGRDGDVVGLERDYTVTQGVGYISDWRAAFTEDVDAGDSLELALYDQSGRQLHLGDLQAGYVSLPFGVVTV